MHAACLFLALQRSLMVPLEGMVGLQRLHWPLQSLTAFEKMNHEAGPRCCLLIFPVGKTAGLPATLLGRGAFARVMLIDPCTIIKCPVSLRMLQSRLAARAADGASCFGV